MVMRFLPGRCQWLLARLMQERVFEVQAVPGVERGRGRVWLQAALVRADAQ